MWRATCAVAILVGCQNSQPVAEKKTTPPPVVAPADVAPVMIDAAAPIDAPAPADAGVDAPTPAKKVVERKGEGACKVDADCEVSVWQKGCCTSACTGYAISKKLLASRKAEDNCEAKKVECPPPAPCPLPTFLAETAICKRGTCTAVGSTVSK